MFGLGEVEKVDRITIHWPGKDAGEPTVIEKPVIDKEHTIKPGVK